MFASDLSYEVSQVRRRRGELTLPQAHQGRELPHLSAQRPVIRFWDMGEGQVWLDPGDGVQRHETPVPVPYLSGRGRSK